MGYLGYYLAWMALSYAIRQPWLLAGLLGVWLLRGVLPPPGALLGALGRAGRLREQVRLNRANITARRDLATIYLSLLRPRRAAELIEEGLVLAPEDAELLYLHGVALQKKGDHERALQQELAALEREPRIRQGHAYFVAGEALLAMKRWDDAADAFERYVDFNSSDVAAHTLLARAYAGGGDAAAARKWLLEGIVTWHGLPGAMKRRQWRAYLGAQGARVSVLKQPLAIVVALGLAAGCVLGARASYPLILAWFQPGDEVSSTQRAQRAARQCGKVSTGEFEGEYEVVEADDAATYPNFRITRDRILYGEGGVEEICLTRLKERKPGSLSAEAVVRWKAEPTDDPKLDRSLEDVVLLVDVRLDRGSERVAFSMATAEHQRAATRVLLKRKP